MSTEGDSNKQRFNVRIRSTNLGAPTLVDHIGSELLNHLCVCQTCLAVFAAQKESLGKAGCVEGMRIVSQSKVRWQERKAALALGHFTGETLDDYLFDRLTCEEVKAFEHHASICLQCSNDLLDREILINCIKAAFREQKGNVTTLPRAVWAVGVRFPARAISAWVRKLSENG